MVCRRKKIGNSKQIFPFKIDVIVMSVSGVYEQIVEMFCWSCLLFLPVNNTLQLCWTKDYTDIFRLMVDLKAMVFVQLP